jgi:hypothetical protein
MGLVAATAVPNIPRARGGRGNPWELDRRAELRIFDDRCLMTVYSTDGRIDYDLSAKDQIFGSYSYRHVDRQDPRWTKAIH